MIIFNNFFASQIIVYTVSIVSAEVRESTIYKILLYFSCYYYFSVMYKNFFGSLFLLLEASNIISSYQLLTVSIVM